MIQLRKATAEFKYQVKIAKRTSWNNFTEEINPTMNVGLAS